MKRQSRWFRWSVRLVASLCTLLLLLGIALGLYTQTRHFHQWLSGQLLTILREEIDGEVTLDNVSGSLWDGLHLHGLNIRHAGQEIIAIPQTTITLSLLSQIPTLLRSSTLRISINGLTFSQPTIRLVQQGEGDWNITHLFRQKQTQDSEEAQQLRIEIKDVVIDNGQIDIAPATGNAVQCTSLSVKGEVTVLPTGLQVDLGTVNFTLARSGMPDLQYRGDLGYDDTVTPPRLTIKQADVRTASSHLQVAGTLTDFTTPLLALKLTATALTKADLDVLIPGLPLQQDITGSLDVQGSLSALHVVTTAEAADGRVTVDTVVNLQQTPPHYQGTLAWENLVIDKVFSISDLSGKFSGEGSFSGTTLTSGQGSVRTTATNFTLSGRQLGTLRLNGTVNDGQATFTADTDGDIGQLHSESRVTLATPLVYEVSLSARKLEVAHLLTRPPPLPATLNFDAQITGRGIRLEELESAITFTLLPSQVGDLLIQRGEVSGALQNGQLHLDNVTLVAHESTVTAQGELTNLLHAPSGKLSYVIEVPNVAPWLTLAGRSGKGGFSLRGTVNGTLTALRLDGTAALDNLQVDKFALQTGTLSYVLTDVGSTHPQGHVTIHLDDVREPLHLRTVEAKVEAVGLQPANVQVECTARDAALRTHQIKAQARYDRGVLDVTLQELALQLPNGTWQTSQSAHLALQEKTVTITNFLLQRGDQTFSVTGTGSWGGTQDVHLNVKRFSLAELRSLLGITPSLSGSINAEVHVQGTLINPEITANLTTGVFTVAEQTYAGLVVQTNYQRQRLSLNAQLQQDADHALTMNGSIPVALTWTNGFPETAPGEAELSIFSEGVSLAFLSLLSDEIQDVQGIVTVDAHLRGPLSALVPSGMLQLHNGQVHVRTLGVTFTDISVQTRLTPDALQVTHLTLRSGTGQLDGSGTIPLHPATPTLALTLDAKRFLVLKTRQYTSALSGRIEGSGSLQNPALRGTVELSDVVLRPDRALLQSGPPARDPTIVIVQTAQELVNPPQRTESGTSAGPIPAIPLQAAFFARLTLDLTVKIPRGTWVYLKEGSIELMGQLRAQKVQDQEPALTGMIETVRGTYAFHGRNFRLEQGRMTFTGTTPIDPTLDIVGRYTLPQYKVDVVIGGTARTPTLTLRSDPSLEQAEILALLLFGKPVDALTQGQRSSLETQALQAAAGYIAADLRQSVAEQLGVDVLEFAMGETWEQSRVGVGKYLAPYLYLSASQQMGETPEQEVAIEYQWSEHWQLKGTTSSRGNSGIDVLWQRRY